MVDNLKYFSRMHSVTVDSDLSQSQSLSQFQFQSRRILPSPVSTKLQSQKWEQKQKHDETGTIHNQEERTKNVKEKGNERKLMAKIILHIEMLACFAGGLN
jgi:hypothetical protein